MSPLADTLSMYFNSHTPALTTLTVQHDSLNATILIISDRCLITFQYYLYHTLASFNDRNIFTVCKFKYSTFVSVST